MYPEYLVLKIHPRRLILESERQGWGERKLRDSCQDPAQAAEGFGGPQGMFVIESAIYKAAEKMNIEPSKIQKLNLLNHKFNEICGSAFSLFSFVLIVAN